MCDAWRMREVTAGTLSVSGADLGAVDLDLVGVHGGGLQGYLGGLVFKAHRWLYHSTLGSRVIKKKKYLRAVDLDLVGVHGGVGNQHFRLLHPLRLPDP